MKSLHRAREILATAGLALVATPKNRVGGHAAGGRPADELGQPPDAWRIRVDDSMRVEYDLPPCEGCKALDARLSALEAHARHRWADYREGSPPPVNDVSPRKDDE